MGLLLDTELLYSYRGGTASLIGFDEFTDISTPPKKYLIKTFNGSDQPWRGSWPDCATRTPLDRMTQGGSNNYSIDGSYSYTSWVAKNGEIQYTNVGGVGICYGIIGGGYCRTTTANQTLWQTIGSWDVSQQCCTPDGTIYYTHSETATVTLSHEDTESNAINRLLNSASWSPWQSTPIYPYYQQRTSGFNFLYREVRTKTITTEKYNPGINYKLSYTIQRRTYGSSDPFVDAETIQTQQKPNSSGDFEIDIENQSGYESKITNLTISL